MPFQLVMSNFHVTSLFFRATPTPSTPRSRIDTKLYSVVTITELFPMARSEIFLLKVSAVIAVDL
jgi:hypothetical protein